MKTFKFKDQFGNNYDLILKRTKYKNNNLALVATTTEYEPYCSFSVNLKDDLPENQMFVDVNKVPNAISFLIDNGIATKIIDVVESGFISYPLVEVDLRRIDENYIMEENDFMSLEVDYDENRINVLDSDGEFIDYVSFDSENFVDRLKDFYVLIGTNDFATANFLCNMFVSVKEVSSDKNYLVSLYGEDFVNRIGQYYIGLK